MDVYKQYTFNHMNLSIFTKDSEFAPENRAIGSALNLYTVYTMIHILFIYTRRTVRLLNCLQPEVEASLPCR